MTDLEPILPLWRELQAAGSDFVLATIVAVEGSSYRKPGARMLISQDGRRAGTVSGGCLEAEVTQRAWWLTSSGPVVERYSTVADDGEMPYGSGCGGVVYILLERGQTANPLLQALESAFHARVPLASATVLDGPLTGQRVIAGASQSSGQNELAELASEALGLRRCIERRIRIDGSVVRVWADYRPARPGLWVFSAGDDVKPLVKMAREMGWFVAVADSRAHLATRERFPTASDVRLLKLADLPGATPDVLPLLPTDAAVVMTHSFEQDSHVLAALLGMGFPLTYVGVLGPQRRTRDLLGHAARLLGVPDSTEQWLAALHAPTGLDLGGETPAAVALSILAEIQQAIHHASAQPLHKVRASTAAANV